MTSSYLNSKYKNGRCPITLLYFLTMLGELSLISEETRLDAIYSLTSASVPP